MSVFDKINLKTMRWVDIFNIIEGNFEKVYDLILENSFESFVEQFDGGQVIYQLEHRVTSDTILLIFRGNRYIGGKEGSSEYWVSNNQIVFRTSLEDDEILTVQFLQSNSLQTYGEEFINRIKELYDKAKRDNIQTLDLLAQMDSLKAYIDENARYLTDDVKKGIAVQQYLEALGTPDIHDIDVNAEIVSSRRGASLLSERLDNMPFKFRNIAEMRNFDLWNGDIAILAEFGVFSMYRITDDTSAQGVVLRNGNRATLVEFKTQQDESLKFYKQTGVLQRPIDIRTFEAGTWFISGAWTVDGIEVFLVQDAWIHISEFVSEELSTRTVYIDGRTFYLQKAPEEEWVVKEFPLIGVEDISEYGSTITAAIREIGVRQNIVQDAFLNEQERMNAQLEAFKQDIYDFYREKIDDWDDDVIKLLRVMQEKSAEVIAKSAQVGEHIILRINTDYSNAVNQIDEQLEILLNNFDELKSDIEAVERQTVKNIKKVAKLEISNVSEFYAAINNAKQETLDEIESIYRSIKNYIENVAQTEIENQKNNAIIAIDEAKDGAIQEINAEKEDLTRDINIKINDIVQKIDVLQLDVLRILEEIGGDDNMGLAESIAQNTRDIAALQEEVGNLRTTLTDEVQTQLEDLSSSVNERLESLQTRISTLENKPSSVDVLESDPENPNEGQMWITS